MLRRLTEKGRVAASAVGPNPPFPKNGKDGPVGEEAKSGTDWSSGLEHELTGELQNTRVVRARYSEKGRRGAILLRAVTRIRVHSVPLRVVKDIECFRTKLEMHVLVNRERLEQAHVEIGARRQIENIAACGAIGQPLRRSERVAVIQARPLHSGGMFDRHRTV